MIPKMEWMMASSNGNKKNIAIVLNKAPLIIRSSVPSLRNIWYLTLLSLLSDNSRSARMAAQEIKNIIPR